MLNFVILDRILVLWSSLCLRAALPNHLDQLLLPHHHHQPLEILNHSLGVPVNLHDSTLINATDLDFDT